MLVKLVNERQAREAERLANALALLDPFQLAPPLFMCGGIVRATLNIRKDAPSMPVKLIDATAAPVRRLVTGKIGSMAEFKEAMDALSKLPQGKAIQLDIAPASYNEMKKDGTKDPAKALANALRRKFNKDGLAYVAYATGENAKFVTIIRKA